MAGMTSPNRTQRRPKQEKKIKLMKTRYITFATVLLTLGSFALPIAQAVNPPPDGGYPGANTAEGQNALLNLNTATGFYNTAVGFRSLESDIQGAFNTAIGAAALLTNTADQNTASGAGALASNTTGAFNTATGAFALYSNAGAANNTATGASALFSNTNGFNNWHLGLMHSL
jgi:hypothetical protein